MWLHIEWIIIIHKILIGPVAIYLSGYSMNFLYTYFKRNPGVCTLCFRTWKVHIHNVVAINLHSQILTLVHEQGVRVCQSQFQFVCGGGFKWP